MVFKNILVIVQRSNGDVFLSASLIDQLKRNLKPSSIDLLVNDDTLAIAKTLSNIRQIYTFSYLLKKKQRWRQEKDIFNKIYRKYDLSINLTASDRSVLYALLASKYSISAIENNKKKSWWKKILLQYSYVFDNKKHILLNNLAPLQFLGITSSNRQLNPKINQEASKVIQDRLKNKHITNFLIFHPSAQYHYKIYPHNDRIELLALLNKLNVSIIITGGNSIIDQEIKAKLPEFDNVINWIGETSIDEYLALSHLSLGYIGMDTLNMHIAAAQSKQIFAIFGPTILSMWSPWSNKLELSALENKPLQSYGNISIFQANMICVACGKSGCNGSGNSQCLSHISPQVIYREVKEWYQNVRV